MSNVQLTIGGRSFTLACADGQEGHVEELGRLIDGKVAAAGVVGQTETRMLLFAAIMLADELHTMRAQPQAHQPQAQSAAPRPEAPAAATPAEIAPETLRRLEAIAGRIENLADLLERSCETS